MIRSGWARVAPQIELTRARQADPLHTRLFEAMARFQRRARIEWIEQQRNILTIQLHQLKENEKEIYVRREELDREQFGLKQA